MKIQNHNVQTDNPLGSAPVGGLILKFSVPAIISMLVSALYNIVDQIFIGQGVGMLGNAATNVAFPVTIFSTAIALLLGIGGASSYNLESGAGHDEKASYIAGASLSMLGISGILIDPDFHNAVMHVEDEKAGDNMVVEELQKGYTYKGFVVRHSMVKVAN